MSTWVSIMDRSAWSFYTAWPLMFTSLPWASQIRQFQQISTASTWKQTISTCPSIWRLYWERIITENWPTSRCLGRLRRYYSRLGNEIKCQFCIPFSTLRSNEMILKSEKLLVFYSYELWLNWLLTEMLAETWIWRMKINRSQILVWPPERTLNSLLRHGKGIFLTSILTCRYASRDVKASLLNRKWNQFYHKFMARTPNRSV